MRDPKEFKVCSVDTDGVTVVIALFDTVNSEILRVEADAYELIPVPKRKKRKTVEPVEDSRQVTFPEPDEVYGIGDASLFEPHQ